MLLFTSDGGDAPANILWSRDPIFDDHPENLAEIAKAVFNLKDATPDDPALKEMARTITDERNNVACFEVPDKLTAGARVYMTTTFVNRSCLPGRVLAGHFFPLLVDSADHENNCVLPEDFWPPELALQWEESAKRAPPARQVAGASEMHANRQKDLAEAKQAAARGELVILTPAAAAELRRLAGSDGFVVEVSCVSAGSGFRHVFNLLQEPASCVISFVSEGIRIQIPDELSVSLIQGTVIDLVESAAGRGFAFRNPNAK
jgi:Fe-S cluster assembly iron-binding protein IscA